MSAAVRYAFFDLDGTLINDTSLISCYDAYVGASGSQVLSDEWRTSCARLTEMRMQNCSREEQNAWFYRHHFAAMPVCRIHAAARDWFAVAGAVPGYFKQTVLDCLARHRRAGVEIVLVTGSFLEAARCVGEPLGVSHYLCAPLEQQDGVYTGTLTAGPMIGQGKAVAVARFLQEHGASATDCYGYGDDSSDLPFLQLLGHPHAVEGACPLLLQHAGQHDWAVPLAASC